MKNSRHYKRYAMKCSGYFTDSKLQRVRFHVNDISASGMNATTDREIEGNMLSIHFDITGMCLPHAKQLKGVVIRKKRQHTLFTYAIRFTDLPHTEIIELDEYLRYTHNNSLNTQIAQSDDFDRITVSE